MLKYQIRILCSVLAVAVSACADGGYNPVVGAGYNTGFNNGLNNGWNNGLNNGLNNGWNNGVFNNGFNMNGMPCNWNQSNMQACNPYSALSYSTYYNPYLMYYNPYSQGIAAAGLDWRAQLMFNPSFRINSGLYYPADANSNVYVRRYPTYTPTDCACYTAPCDCNQVLRELHQSGRYSRKIDRINNKILRKNERAYRKIGQWRSRISPTYHPSHGTDGCYPGSISSARSCTTVVTHHHHTSSSSGNTSPHPGSTSSSPAPSELYHVTLTSDDAEQLFKRLARNEIDVYKNGNLHKYGDDYFCVKSKDGKSYYCDFDLDLQTGVVKTKGSRTNQEANTENSNYSANATSDIEASQPNSYNGGAVSIAQGAAGRAILRFTADPEGAIKASFNRLNATTGDSNNDDDIVDLPKLQLKRIPSGTGFTYEVEIRVDTPTGKVVPVAQWGQPLS